MVVYQPESPESIAAVQECTRSVHVEILQAEYNCLHAYIKDTYEFRLQRWHYLLREERGALYTSIMHKCTTHASNVAHKILGAEFGQVLRQFESGDDPHGYLMAICDLS